MRMIELDKIKELTDEEVEKIIKECGFGLIEVKHFKNDTIYYLEEEED